MSPELKIQWITALTSGNYKQGHYALRSNNHYCCLGVLCEITNEPIQPGQTFPVDSFLSKIGLTWDATNNLAMKNDRGVTFSEIANYIETNPSI